MKGVSKSQKVGDLPGAWSISAFAPQIVTANFIMTVSEIMKNFDHKLCNTSTCMATVECRLCIAGIPHDYEHSLQIGPSNETETECLEASFYAAPTRNQQGLQEWKLDTAGMVCLLYLICIAEATAFIVFLILWRVQKNALQPEPWAAAAIGLAGLFVTIHLGFVLRLPSQLTAKKACYVLNLFAVLFWGSLLVWSVVHFHEGRA